MTRKALVAILAGAMAGFIWAQPVALDAQAAPAAQSIGSVRISQGVVANGQALSAGTYTLRVTGDPVTPVVGQTVTESRWVEFMQGGQVKGKEMATVIAPAIVKEVQDRPAPVSAGGAKVQMLKGNDYLRVWVNRGGLNYLIHLATK